ncbi:MAG: hypothetical protein ACK59A_01625 [Cyanobacteriota bacterium]
MGRGTLGSRPVERFIRAIERIGQRVTVGDVASATGESVAAVEQGLLALAVEVGGHLQVAEDGAIAYVFPRRLRAIHLSRLGWTRMRNAWRKLWSWLLWLLKVSFGVVLVVLLIAVVMALVAIVVAWFFRSGSGAQGEGGSAVFFGLGSPRGPEEEGADPSSRSGEAGTSPTEPMRRPRAKPELNFFEAVFSFLFGDGPPNADLEERRWREIAQLIRRHQGVVIAEQLMPYLDPSQAQVLTDDLLAEEVVLPTLVRFNGQPHVSPQGDLVYAFPDLQVTARAAADRRPSRQPATATDPLAAADPPFLREHPWRFSRASATQQLTAGGMGLVLLALAALLARMVATHAPLVIGWAPLFSGLATVAMVYGAAFLLVPLGRWLWIQKRNNGVAQRNAVRRGYAFHLARGSFHVQRKLAYALTHASQRRVDANRLAYTSETDLLSQDARHTARVDGEWERRLDRARRARRPRG